MSFEDMPGKPKFGEGGVGTFGNEAVVEGVPVENERKSQRQLGGELNTAQRKKDFYTRLMTRLGDLEKKAA